jgi:hypothetical protein
MHEQHDHRAGEAKQVNVVAARLEPGGETDDSG